MSIPIPDPFDTVIHGGSGNDILVDRSDLVPHPGSKGLFFHATYLYGHGGDDIFMGESGSGPNQDHGGLDLFDGGSGVDGV